ncbi:MAG TPA: methyltransferase domain-containing protein, partial [Rhodanobacteraceae bacterium]
ADVIALDFALPMLRAARHHAGWRHPFQRIAADARHLPFPDHCMDVVYANLCLPWCGAPKAALREFARVLQPGGFLVASSLGPDTLMELRAAWAAVDPQRPHVDACIDMHDIGDAALAAGLKDPVLDTDHITLSYANVRALLAELRGSGATNAHPDRARTLTGNARFQRMLAAYDARASDGRVPATFEVVTLHAWGPPKNFLPRYGGRETPFEVVQWAERAPRPHRTRDQ